MSASFANDGRDPAAEARRLLTRNERYEFRLMAAHPEIVEAEIAKGTDEKPTSHRQVMQAIQAHRRKAPTAKQATLTDRVAELESAVDMLAAALGYADRGWPVFPLHTPQADGSCSCRKECGKQCGKHPRTAHGLLDATIDHDQIRKWWSMWPDANIAVRTGVACDLFDIDHDDMHDGTADLPAFDMPGGPIVRTGNGWHFYVLPTGLGNRGRLSEFCDWRGDGGYSILPPSLHRSGRRYAWFVSFDTPLNHAPAELVAVLQPPAPRAPARPAGSPQTAAAVGDAFTLARRTYMGRFKPDPLLDKVRNAPDGTRNIVLNWAAVALGFAVYNRRCTEAEGREALRRIEDAAVAAGLTPLEAGKTADSGYSAGLSGRDPSTKKPKANAA